MMEFFSKRYGDERQRGIVFNAGGIESPPRRDRMYMLLHVKATYCFFFCILIKVWFDARCNYWVPYAFICVSTSTASSSIPSREANSGTGTNGG